MTAMPKKFVLASGNAGKIREITHLLDGLGATVVAQSELGVEEVVDGDQLYGVWSAGCFFPLGRLDASG